MNYKEKERRRNVKEKKKSKLLWPHLLILLSRIKRSRSELRMKK
jgi:hypothetical protein